MTRMFFFTEQRRGELDIISTDLLWAMEQEISWKWIGHTIRKPFDTITRQTVTTRKKRTTDVGAYVKETVYTWRQLAQNRGIWQSHVGDL